MCLKQSVVLQEELVSARETVCVLVQQNAALQEKLEDQRGELQAEVHLLKGKLKESQEEKQSLRQGDTDNNNNNHNYNKHFTYRL